MKIQVPSLLALAPMALAATPLAAQGMGKVQPEEITAATRYALPHLLTGLRTRCDGELAPGGYLSTQGGALHARLAEGADAAWPEARIALTKFALKDGADEGAAFLADLPDENLRPFVNGMLTQLVAREVVREQCSDIERGLELLDPLPAENLAGLVGFMIEMADKDKANTTSETEASQ